jgi:predicted RNA-binding Zn ribbon-like protein
MVTPATHSGSHEHAIDLDAALDFLNTLELENGQVVDHLHKPADAAAWLEDHGLIHKGDERGWTAADLERTRRTRDALREVVDAVVEGRQPKTDAVEAVNQALDARPQPRLVIGDGRVEMGHRHVGSCAEEALVPIADVIVRELANGRPERFRICDNDTCRWTFFDASPTGRRRWCDMRTCGNRAKAARHRAKAKGLELKLVD